MKKILVAFDGSQGSKCAVEVAKDIGLKFNSHLIVLTVVPLEKTMNVYRNMLYADEIKENIDSDARERLNIAKEVVGNYPGNIETIILDGDPAKEIVAYAEEENVNLIVLGNRGHGMFSRTLLGSVSNKIINQTTISTLVVKKDIKEIDTNVI